MTSSVQPDQSAKGSIAASHPIASWRQDIRNRVLASEVAPSRREATGDGPPGQRPVNEGAVVRATAPGAAKAATPVPPAPLGGAKTPGGSCRGGDTTGASLQPDTRFGPGATQQRWRHWLAPLAQEVKTPVAASITGHLPEDLCGTLYFNGPTSFGSPHRPIKNLFDGDGGILKVDISPAGAAASCVYVQTDVRRRELESEAVVFGGISQRPPRGARARMDGTADRRPANTNFVVHHGRGWALHEGDKPHIVDPQTLETQGQDDLDGLLGPNHLYSAHPKICPVTDDLYNIGLHYEAELKFSLYFMRLQPYLQVYRTSAVGKHEAVCPAPLRLPFAAGIVHDFALTPHHAVVPVPPLVIDKPLSLALCRVTPEQSLRYRPELKTHLGIIDRLSGACRWATTQAFLVFHTVQATEKSDGSIELDVCAFADGSVTKLTSAVMRGEFNEVPVGHLRRLSVQPDNSVQTLLLCDPGLDFPRVMPRAAEAPYQLVHGAGWSGTSPFADLPMTFDQGTGKLVSRPMSLGREFAGEMVPVAKRHGVREKDVWLLTLVLDARSYMERNCDGLMDCWAATKPEALQPAKAGFARQAPADAFLRWVSPAHKDVDSRFEVRIYDGAHPTDDAVCRITLPFAVPFRFHGNFVCHSLPER